MKRRVLFFGGATFLALLPLAVAPIVTFAQVPANVSAYDASGHAAAVHVVGYSGSFPNFATGAVDNRYPLASFGMDSSPGSSATASYEDYGPLGATEYPGGVAYAIAHYPDNPDSSVDLNNANPGQAPGAPAGFPPQLIPTPLPTAVTSSGPRATAHADELNAKAHSVYVGSADQAIQNAWSNVTSVMAPDGTLTETAESYIGQATFGSGALVISKVDVVAKIVNAAGQVTTTQKVKVGSVTAGGQTVEVSDQTSSFTLGGVVYTISLTSPEKSVDDGQTNLLVTGLHVGIGVPNTQPPQCVPNVPCPSVATTSADLILGEAQLYSVLSPAEILGIVSTSGGVPSLNTGIGVVSAPPPIVSAPITQPVRVTAPAPRFILAAASRKPLAIAFLAWETLVFSGVAAWVWARKGVPV